MGRRPRPRATLDPDQAAALHQLVEAFGVEQLTITAVQASPAKTRVTSAAKKFETSTKASSDLD